MNYKITTFLLALIFVAGFVVAATSDVAFSSTTLRFNQNDTLESFTITNTGALADDVAVTIPSSAQITAGQRTINFALAPNGVLNIDGAGDSETINAQASGDLGSFPIGQFSTSFNVFVQDISNPSDNKTQAMTLEFTKSFCDQGSRGNNLSITSIDIDNEGNGDDDNWEILDTISITVEVENVGNDRIDDVVVELAVIDENGNNVADDFDYENSDEDKMDLGDLRDGDNDEVEFRFRIPADVDRENYKLAIKAYEDGNEDDVCTDSENGELFKDIEVTTDSDDEIVIDDIRVSPTELTCGEEGFMTMEVFNLNAGEQDDVLITLRNSELDMDSSFHIRNLDEGDDGERIEMGFRIPANADNKQHMLDLVAFFDYDEDDGDFDDPSAYGEETDEFTTSVKVIGCGVGSGDGDGDSASGLVITAELESEANAGEELVVSVTFTNTEADAQSVVVDASSFSSWADSVDISSRILNLDAGDGETVTFTFDVKESASGTESFVIEAISNGVTETQEVDVEISSGSDFEGFDFDLSGNGLIWIIAIINVILIILIILVAVRLSRR